MKIYLYLKNKILSFTIPQKVSGNFNFDEDPMEESKLINIEAIDAEWHIYSTSEVSVMSNGMVQGRIRLEKNNYYVIKRAGIEYLIFVTDTFDSSFLPYSFTKELNLVIGNDASCNVKYNCPYVKGVAGKIRMEDNFILLDTRTCPIYLNNSIVEPNTNNHTIKSGDQLNIYGLKIMVLNGFLLLNNPNNSMSCNFGTARISSYQLSYGNEPQDLEIKDKELFSKEQYFSKAPRIRRIIKTKEIDLSPPPRKEGENEMPLLLTVGPMLTMGLVSGMMLLNTLSRVSTGQASFVQALPAIVSSVAMLASTILWPTLTRMFNKVIKARRKRELIHKYTKYLNKKREELEAEQKLQKEILFENLLPVSECLNIIQTARARFWDRRIDQNDFLQVRVGIGDELLDAKVNYPKEGFTIDEDDLKREADLMVKEYKYIHEVPIGYSLFENRITAIMGENEKCHNMLNNIILQLLTFYSYEDIKLVIITTPSNEGKLAYTRYLKHTFSNDLQIRFFSSTVEGAKNLCDFLYMELQNRIQTSEGDSRLFKPYYLIITDNYSQIRRHHFAKTLTEMDANVGFSLLILEKQLSKLPSKCANFINLDTNSSTILKNSFESQELINFKDEVNGNIDMLAVTRMLANIPIEFEEGNKLLPDTVTFLEMERVGKVEQLNILNRWDTNDSTTSLRAEIGLDEEGSMMYLDLHEKYHGPHGLIAGMTGSGKSEFIITYILSMAINYSPDDVAFILIDYKGGGLAGAFENKATGVCLPHLAGTITNLDKAEMDRTLVSIDSEIKRRQQIFNEARDKLGESTIDIYKYQRYFKEGRLAEPVPHLFIISDEFAELKSQQPDFMDNLISVARIGRSLGVHLILATQKPSGVVNDQIWSNTKFRVCLKVQDAQDSKEMLKRPEAASIKQTGRFYLQVGYDEFFALGQSAWCGAKYYPSEKIIKQVDKSVDFIDDNGNVIKSIQSGNNIKIEAQGEQLAAIMKNIIEVAAMSNKRAKRLWLNAIEPIILVDNLEKKYGFKPVAYDVRAVLGEYDAPERQEQNLLTYSLAKDGNTIVYGNDEIERENMLNAILYSICKTHSSKEINIYIVDYGSEQMRIFDGFPQIGGLVFLGDDEGIKNLFKLMAEEIKSRKKRFLPFGGTLESYNARNEKKMPQILFIINNYEGLLEIYNTISEDIASLARECERYGIILLITCNTPATVGRRVSQSFNNKYTLHLSDSSDYYGVFGTKSKTKPRDIQGRGLANTNGIHEFQTASIVPENVGRNDYILNVSKKIKELDSTTAKAIPALPEKVTLDIVEKDITSLAKVPIGISKETLRVVKYDFTAFTSTSIVSNKLNNIDAFMASLLEVFLRIPGLTIFFLDTTQALPSAKSLLYNERKINYFDNAFDENVDRLIDVEENPENKKYNKLYVFYGIEKLKSKTEPSKIEKLLNAIKTAENSNMIFCDSSKNLKAMDMDLWFSKIKNNTDGIWIGKGFAEQQNFRLSRITKEMSADYKNNFGFFINESNAELIKVLEFNNLNREGDENEE